MEDVNNRETRCGAYGKPLYYLSIFSKNVKLCLKKTIQKYVGILIKMK